MTIDIAYGIIDDLHIQQLEEHLNDDTACQLTDHHTKPQYHEGPGETLAIVSCPVCNTTVRRVVCGKWVSAVIAKGGINCGEHRVSIAYTRFVAI